MVYRKNKTKWINEQFDFIDDNDLIFDNVIRVFAIYIILTNENDTNICQ